MGVQRIFCGCHNYSKVALRYMSRTQHHIRRYPKIVGNEVLKDPAKEITLEEKIFNSLKGKLVYNSLVTRKNLYVRWKIRAEQFQKERKIINPDVTPVSLKYMFEDSDIMKKASEDEVFDEVVEEDDMNDEDIINLPYSEAKRVEVESDDEMSDITYEKYRMLAHQDICPKPINGRRWMSDYECFDEELTEDSEFEPTEIDYGTPDPTYPASIVPCGGCGAHLHCRNPSIPGYLPQELFKRCKKKDLMSIICQRCTFLKNYNTALAVNVDRESYPKLLAKLKKKDVLVILMVDMTDFPCSIWPKLLETIGEDKPLFVVGNKIDLLPGDSPNWLETAKKSLMKELPKNANILHTCFVSAKTGFGVEEMINKLFSKWGKNGDVYLVGCTNVGKSSLFNALINSDYCRSKAIDLVQRAVTSPWPGTTLNLLKFPITKLVGWKAFLRTKRLMVRQNTEVLEKKLAKFQSEMENTHISKLPTIMGTIGLTFKRPPEEYETHNIPDEKLFAMPIRTPKALKKDTRKVFNPDDFKTSFWCYDTPGVVHDDQIINLLTTEELMKTLPQTPIKPHVFSVRPEQTLFIGGLARVDLLTCNTEFARIIVYASHLLPTTICATEFAEDVYETLVGTSYMGVPCGSLSRLEKWPELKYREDFDMVGEGNALVCSEIVLSSVGWIGVSLPLNFKATVRPWTPLARGIHLRETPVLKLTAKLRRRRVSNTPTYHMAQI